MCCTEAEVLMKLTTSVGGDGGGSFHRVYEHNQLTYNFQV